MLFAYEFGDRKMRMRMRTVSQTDGRDPALLITGIMKLTSL